MPLKQAALRSPQNDLCKDRKPTRSASCCHLWPLSFGDRVEEPGLFLGKGRFETLRLQIPCKKQASTSAIPVVSPVPRTIALQGAREDKLKDTRFVVITRREMRSFYLSLPRISPVVVEDDRGSIRLVNLQRRIQTWTNSSPVGRSLTLASNKCRRSRVANRER